MLKNPRTFWVTALVTLGANLTSAGFSLAAILGGGGVLGLYAGARSLGFLAASVGVVAVRSKEGLVTLALASALVQAADAGIGLAQGQLSLTLGPLVLAGALGASGLVLARR